MAEVRYRIHPAIGVARVGDADRSGDGFFFVGPEFPGGPPPDRAAYKIDGKVAPQAARFRIFEYEKRPDGKFHPTREVTLGVAQKITWTVHLANRKANFCKFLGQTGATDPLFKSYKPEDIRNFAVNGAKLRKDLLELDPGERTISGRNQKGMEFDIKRPQPLEGKDITTLGELRTDSNGCLLVIGGKGHSGFDRTITRSDGCGTGNICHYANNDSWFDDVSDGPVSAIVEINGKSQEADGAWILVGPPDFVPSVRNYRTMYDSLVDVIVREGIPLGDYALSSKSLSDVAAMQAEWKTNKSLPNFKPSFKEHIYPILCSLSRAMRIHSRSEGEVTKYHLTLDPKHYLLLGGPNSDNQARKEIFDLVRDPKTLQNAANPPEPKKMPLTFGDYYDHGPTHPGFFHTVSEVQYEWLKAWSDGRFNADWDGVAPKAATQITPDGLDRASLENASGGAFYPGIEASWLMTKKIVYREALRLDYKAGPGERKKIAKIPVPLAAGTGKRDLLLEAGAFSQQMAGPWQADFFECRADDNFKFGNPPMKRRIAWWPAQRPDNVFPENHPEKRLDWARDENGNAFSSDIEMVEKWSLLGFIVEAGGDLVEVGGPPIGPALVAGAGKPSEGQTGGIVVAANSPRPTDPKA